jgi:hypothetical protein
LICDLQKLASANNLPLLFTKYLQPYQRLLWPLAFIIAMYLGGVPAHDPRLFVLRNSPGWYYLSYMKPENVCDADYKWFYLFFASSLVVASIPHLGPLKSFFETRFCQYLGKHSFALYLVHGPVLWMLADRVYLAAGWARENNMGKLYSYSHSQFLLLCARLGRGEIATTLLSCQSSGASRENTSPWRASCQPGKIFLNWHRANLLDSWFGRLDRIVSTE